MEGDGHMRNSRRRESTDGLQLRATVVVALLGALALIGIVNVSGAPRVSTPALAAGATLRIDPPAQTVAGGQKFTVNIIQNADVPSLGAQTNFVFDPKLLRIVGVDIGPPYRGATFLFGSAEQGTNTDIGKAVVAANRDGTFRNLATFIPPGGGSPVPPGDAVFLKLTLQALGPGGKSPLTLRAMDLSPMEMIDGQGNTIPLTAKNGEVTVSGGSSAPPEGATPAATAAATLSSTVAASERGAAALLTVAPASSKIAVGATTTVDLRVKLPVESLGVQTDLSFDKSVVEIVSVEQGEAWSKGLLVAGVSGQTKEQAISDANQAGTMKGAGVLFYPGRGSVQPAKTPSSASPYAACITEPPASKPQTLRSSTCRAIPSRWTLSRQR
jgi:hypothetical protein